MPRFFCEDIDINKNSALICGDDAKHIGKVLRMRSGDLITICDKHGFDYDCIIKEISDNIHLDIMKKYENTTEPSVNITLFQALPKGDKFDFIIQKAVELGVSKIVPVISKFCVAKADNESFSKKLPRLNKIALEAAKQSGRGIIPEVFNIITLSSALVQCKNIKSIICYEGGGIRISEAISQNEQQVCIFIGSEGGFCEDEIALAVANNVIPVTLGKLILRCETAPIACVTLVLNKTLNM